MKKFWILALVAILGCGPTYYKCPSCGAAYKQKWYQHGVPGQLRYECGSCGAKLRESTKEASGWDDSRGSNLEGR